MQQKFSNRQTHTGHTGKKVIPLSPSEQGYKKYKLSLIEDCAIQVTNLTIINSNQHRIGVISTWE